MNRSIGFAGLTLVFAAVLAPAAGASPSPTTTTACRATAVKPKAHDAAVRRENTLDTLVSTLTGAPDTYGVNGAQVTALQNAKAGVSALDQKIASTCYATRAAFHADAEKLFTDYRVYWLRVPQTNVIRAADRLAVARSKLEAAAAKLAPLVTGNAAATAALATMNSQIDAASAKLGTPPALGAGLAPVPGLAPAVDMTANDAALVTAHADLVAVRTALRAARAAGHQAVAALKAG